MIEAELDFADESDVPGSVADAVWDDVRGWSARSSACGGIPPGGDHPRGLFGGDPGAPNAGKSSLLNALARRDVAIVTDEPGTTRDLVEVALDLGGLKVVVTDTAGIREDAGKVEAIGIERAWSSVQRADLVLCWRTWRLRRRCDRTPATDAPVLRIGSKAIWSKPRAAVGGRYDLACVGKTGDGVDRLADHDFAAGG